MAITYNNLRGEFGPRLPGQPQRVAQQSKPTHPVAQPVAEPPGATLLYISKTEFDALKAEVASLRELIARQAVAPATKSRAEYYREYRKRTKL